MSCYIILFVRFIDFLVSFVCVCVRYLQTATYYSTCLIQHTSNANSLQQEQINHLQSLNQSLIQKQHAEQQLVHDCEQCLSDGTLPLQQKLEQQSKRYTLQINTNRL